MSKKLDVAANTDLALASYVKLIRTAEALHAQVSRGLIAEGLTPSQFSTLKVLRKMGRLAQKEIARHLLKTGGNVTLVVDNLEKQGLVTRTRDLVDRRLTYVELTAPGRKLFDRLYPAHVDRIVAAMAALSVVGQTELIELLEDLQIDESEPICSTD